MLSFTSARHIYDTTINILETNLRLFGSFAAVMKGAAQHNQQRRGRSHGHN
jgi:hypothetical protein